MTVTVEHPLPPIATIVAAVDTAAREAANDARRAAVPIARACLPSRTGRVRRGTVGRVNRTATGYRLEIAATSRVRYPNGVTAKQVLRFITGGTGIFGPLGRPIRPRKADAFVLPTWAAESVRGQPGHDYFGAARAAADGVVVRAFADGARHAVDLVARTF
jgi:hypothetical protein